MISEVGITSLIFFSPFSAGSPFLLCYLHGLCQFQLFLKTWQGVGQTTGFWHAEVSDGAEN